MATRSFNRFLPPSAGQAQVTSCSLDDGADSGSGGSRARDGSSGRAVDRDTAARSSTGRPEPSEAARPTNPREAAEALPNVPAGARQSLLVFGIEPNDANRVYADEVTTDSRLSSLVGAPDFSAGSASTLAPRNAKERAYARLMNRVITEGFLPTTQRGAAGLILGTTHAENPAFRPSGRVSPLYATGNDPRGRSRVRTIVHSLGLPLTTHRANLEAAIQRKPRLASAIGAWQELEGQMAGTESSSTLRLFNEAKAERRSYVEILVGICFHFFGRYQTRLREHGWGSDSEAPPTSVSMIFWSGFVFPRSNLDRQLMTLGNARAEQIDVRLSSAQVIRFAVADMFLVGSG